MCPQARRLRLYYPVQLLEELAVPEGGPANSIINGLKCQPALIDPKETNGFLVEVSTRGDSPPRNANAPGQGGAAKANKNQAPLPAAAPSIPQGGARWMLS